MSITHIGQGSQNKEDIFKREIESYLFTAEYAIYPILLIKPLKY